MTLPKARRSAQGLLPVFLQRAQAGHADHRQCRRLAQPAPVQPADSTRRQLRTHAEEGPPAADNNEEWSEFAKKVAKKRNLIVEPSVKTLGGEDFAFYQEKIKGVFIHIGTDNHILIITQSLRSIQKPYP